MINIMFLGPTGVGKSTVCNYIVKSLGMMDARFVESPDAVACTHDPIGEVRDRYRIIDNPGLLDTRGIGEDRENIKKIVTYAKDCQYINAVFFLVNYQHPRFDDGIQNAIKLYVDSFTRGVLGRIGLVITRFVFDEENIRGLTDLVGQYRQLIEARCGCHLNNLPFFFLDCHPEELRKNHCPQDWIDEVDRRSKQQATDLLRWTDTLQPFSTTDAVFGEYEHDRLLREEAERRARDNAVVDRRIETNIRELSRTVAQIHEDRGWTVHKGGLFNVGKTVWHSNVVHAGNTSTINMVEEQREVVTRGNGSVSTGDWNVVRQWTTTETQRW